MNEYLKKIMNDSKKVNYSNPEFSKKDYDVFLRTRAYHIGSAFPMLDLKGKMLLDIGCGPGMFIKYARESSAFISCGFDLDKSRIYNASRVIGDNAGLCVADAGKSFPYKDCIFDIVFCSHLLEHIENPAITLKEAFRVLKEKGEMFLMVPNDYNLAILPFRPLRWILKHKESFLKKHNRYNWLKDIVFNDIDHFREYNKSTITQVLKENGFNIISIKSRGVTLPSPFKHRLSRINKFIIYNTAQKLILPCLRSEMFIYARKA